MVVVGWRAAPGCYNAGMPTKRVIIADDALDFGRMLQASLATLDFQPKVTLVPSAEEALLETRRGATDLLISDVRLPGMSGFDLVRKARVRYPDLKIIVVTGLKDETMPRQAESAGANAFFNKPVPIGEFLQCVQELLGQAGATPRPAPQPPAPRIHESIPGLLANLRGRLGARAVLLANAAAEVLAQAGEAISAPLPAVLEAAAALEKTARLLGRQSGVMAFDGHGGDLLVAPCAPGTLICALEPGSSTLRLALAVEEMLAAQQKLNNLPAEAAVEPPAHPSQPVIEESAVEPAAAVTAAPVSTPVEEAPAAPPALPDLDSVEEDLGDLEGLFGPGQPAAPISDLDSFWEQAAANSGAAGDPASNALSFEDALRLGLTPPQAEEE